MYNLSVSKLTSILFIANVSIVNSNFEPLGLKKWRQKLLKRFCFASLQVCPSKIVIFGATGIFPATNVTHARQFFSKNKIVKSFWSTTLFIYILSFE